MLADNTQRVALRYNALMGTLLSDAYQNVIRCIEQEYVDFDDDKPTTLSAALDYMEAYCYDHFVRIGFFTGEDNENTRVAVDALIYHYAAMN
jgi:hypothetical protein